MTFFEDATAELSNLATGLQQDIREVFHFTEVILDTPVTVTPTTTESQLLAGKPYKWCFSFIIRVRSMGTATYIRLGNSLGQQYTLALYGQTLEWSGGFGQVCDLGKMYVVSDTSDAVLEVIAEYVPLNLVGFVNQSVGSGF